MTPNTTCIQSITTTAGLALGLGHLGHRLGPPTRGRPQILGQKLIYLKKEFRDIGKKKKN